MDAAFAWQLSLVDENGTEVLVLLQDAFSDALDGNDGIIITAGDLVLLDSATISSGNYTCVLTVDGGDVIVESNETDNTLTSAPFEIINYDELYADDLERSGVSSVDVVDIVAVDREPEKVYQPGHPKADKDGYIFMAAVNTEEELVEMLEASRQYENNVEVVSTLRGLMMRTISMGK